MSISTDELEGIYSYFCSVYPSMSDPKKSSGCCFWASLTLAELADGQGLSVELIRWSVIDDAHFEHWAVRTHGNQLCDPTAAQIDGNASPWRSISDYPSNYLAPKAYPASLFLESFRQEQDRIERCNDVLLSDAFYEHADNLMWTYQNPSQQIPAKAPWWIPLIYGQFTGLLIALGLYSQKA